MESFYRIPIFSDPTWYLIQPSIYSVVEPSAYLICAIMPTLRHLTRRIARAVGLSTSQGYLSYGRTAASGEATGRVRSILRHLSSKGPEASKAPDLDVEMEIFREQGGGWNKIKADKGAGSERASHGILRKTDVNVYVEQATSSSGYVVKNSEGVGEESSMDSKSMNRGNEFGDDVPLHAR